MTTNLWQARAIRAFCGGAITAVIALHLVAAANAASPPDDKCEMSKSKAAGKYALCVANLDAKAIKKTIAADSEKLTKCADKFNGSFVKAEDKAEGACPSSDDATALQGTLDTCIGSVVTALGGVPGPGGDQAKCQSGKVKEAGKYASCLFKALAKGVKDSLSPDPSKCEEKLSTRWGKLEEGLCSTNADQAAIKGQIDACYAVVAGNLDPTIEYQQDFEGLNQASSSALSDDGWLVYGNVFGPDWSRWYGYGAFPAPNGGAGFSGIDLGQGGAEQGLQQLVIYNDYNNGNHGDASHAHIESNVYHERTILAGDVGRTLTFKVDGKRGNINDPGNEHCPCSSTAIAFIKTLDPGNGYAMTNFITYDTTSLPQTWTSFSISLDITAGLANQILQFGFSTTASDFQPSGNFYDNIVVSSVPTP